MNHITDGELALDSLLEETENPSCGALVVFEGVVRDHHDGREVARMQYTAYEPLAEKVLAELEMETKERFAVAECRIVHRTGDLAIGEASVVVVVRSAHRDSAFDAARYAIDTLKQRVPVWKRDFYSDGSSAYQDGVPLDPDSPGEGDVG